MISTRISDNLFLNLIPVRKAAGPVVAKPAGVHHVYMVDVSGSMYNDLPALRTLLKNRLSQYVNEADTVTIGWFSGRNQYGWIIEGARLGNVQDLERMRTTVDRFLKTVGLTGFKEPLAAISELSDRLRKIEDMPLSFVFMSDGGENQWTKPEVLAAAKAAGENCGGVTVVEYGYYADRAMLADIAAQAGGTVVFAKDFNDYEVAVAKAAGSVMGGKKVSLAIPGDAIEGIAFAMKDGQFPVFAVNNGEVSVPETTEFVAYLSPTADSKKVTDLKATSLLTDHDETSNRLLNFAYAATSVFANRMKSKIVKALLGSLGDVKLMDQFANCFGKQSYSDFVEASAVPAWKPVARFEGGQDHQRMPPENAFTVLDMLELLSSDEDNRVLLDDPSFKYSRVSRGRVDSNTVLTTAEQEQVAELTAKIAASAATGNLKEVAALSAQVSDITNKPEALTFVAPPQPDGYPVNKLTFNENRPNVSILVTKEGTVSLASRKDRPQDVPEVIETKIHRNYSIITDGLVNVEDLPVRLSGATVSAIKKLAKEGRIPAKAFRVRLGSPNEVVIHLTKLPIVNGEMVRDVSAIAFGQENMELVRLKAKQKVVNSTIKERGLERAVVTAMATTYSPESATWLAEQGITANGFAPKGVQAESTDFYVGKELKVKLAGLSALPSLNDAKAGKGAGGKLMATFIPDVDKADDDEVMKQQKEVRAAVRQKAIDIAKTKFAIIVGQTWFSEFASLAENNCELPTGQKVTYDVTEVKVSI